jgi:hypothetical protein
MTVTFFVSFETLTNPCCRRERAVTGYAIINPMPSNKGVARVLITFCPRKGTSLLMSSGFLIFLLIVTRARGNGIRTIRGR